MMRSNNVVSSGGIFDIKQQCYTIRTQEDRLRECVNLVPVVLTTEMHKLVKECVSSHSFYTNFFNTTVYWQHGSDQ